MTHARKTPPRAWRAALEARGPQTLDLEALGRLLVVAAHPDDETLAVSGVMQAVHRRGGRVELVVASDGEAAFPGLDGSGRAELGRARRRELHAALHVQGMADVPVRWLGLPDSRLDTDTVAAELAGSLAGVDSYLAPWPGDPHPDHAAAGNAAAAAAPVTVHGWSYPIWMWPWLEPDDPRIPWHRAYIHHLGPEVRQTKGRALEAFTSQLDPAPGGGPPILTPETMRHFEGDRELVFREPRTSGAPVERFDELYRCHGGDPWRTRTSWYERRKRAVLLACLPREHYRHAAEPGCGTGELTRELAKCCDRVSAGDFAENAVRLTGERVAGLPGVSVQRAALPDGLPDEVDLVVLSEVLYYLDDADLEATRERVATVLAPGGDLVVAHWRGWPAEAPRRAEDVHRALAADERLRMLVEHVDEEFVLHVYRRR